MLAIISIDTLMGVCLHEEKYIREVVMAVKKKTDPSECQSFKMKYIFQNDYNPIYINGAYGGVTPSGEIVASFYFERHPLPNSETWLQDKAEVDPKDLASSAVRVVESGIIVSPRTAKILAEWLLEKVRLAEVMSSEGAELEQGNEEE